MKDEELKYYTHPEMQRFFLEKRGEWQVGDSGWDTVFCKRCIYIGTVYHGDILHYQFAKEYNTVESPINDSLILFLPLPIDPVSPERGLWGMLDGYPFLCRQGNADKTWRLSISNRVIGDSALHYWANTPTLALLKALAEQWGVTV